MDYIRTSRVKAEVARLTVVVQSQNDPSLAMRALSGPQILTGRIICDEQWMYGVIGVQDLVIQGGTELMEMVLIANGAGIAEVVQWKLAGLARNRGSSSSVVGESDELKRMLMRHAMHDESRRSRTGRVKIKVADGAVIERAMAYFSAQVAGKDMVWWIWRNVK